MNTDSKASSELAQAIKAQLFDVTSKCDVAIAPPFLWLKEIKALLANTNIKLAAQNCFYESQGAFTGEISAMMLKSIGCELCILGHSERRHIFGERDSLIFKKVIATLENDMTAILCVGETLEQRESNEHFSVIQKQLDEVIKNLNQAQISKLIVAYEPVWAIGTGKAANATDAEEMHLFIRNYFGEMANQDVAQSVVLLYGGSVKLNNAKELFLQDNIDGFLIGGASLEANVFASIIRSVGG